jgi:hypothetical protein
MADSKKEKKAAWWKKERGERGTMNEKVDVGKEDAKDTPKEANMANFIVLIESSFGVVNIANSSSQRILKFSTSVDMLLMGVCVLTAIGAGVVSTF